MNKFINFILLVFFVTTLLPGCETYKNVAYFKDIPDSSRFTVKTTVYKSLLVQKGDILNVTITTMDPSANIIFGQNIMSSTHASPTTNDFSNGTGGINLNSGSLPSYLVDKNGEIELPLMGKIPAAGLTIDSIKNIIEEKTSHYYKTPSILVRYSNLKVNVLGEVGRPGTYNLTNERNTILDALALAGDLTIFGKRENVILVRDSSGYAIMNRFSLNNMDLVKKDFFYLKQNDVIYVEPNKGKAASLDASRDRVYAIASAILSVLIIWATRVR